MKAPSGPTVTQLILAWANGDQHALSQLIPLVYDQLHRLASYQMRDENRHRTLQTTALVNEAYLKLVDQRKNQFRNRAHFFAIAAKLMRRILIDHARSQQRLKRGGDVLKISIAGTLLAAPPATSTTELISIDQALLQLAQFDSRKSRIVEMRFFGGLNNEEIAAVEKVSTRTIEREWRKAKAWLSSELSR